MNDFQTLWLVWQNEETRLNYHVATLSFHDDKYEFTYTWKSQGSQKVLDALNNGYMLHPSFPDLKKTYVSDKLFAAFDRRLPSNIRLDYDQILKELHLQNGCSKMQLLEQTRGKLANDSYSFEKPLKLVDGLLVTSFFVNGMRHQKGLPENWKEIIESTNRITMQLEPENIVDKNAVAVYTGMGIKLGYVPRFYAAAVSALIKRGLNPTLKINYINDVATPDWWLKVDFQSEIEDMSLKDLKGIDPLFEYAV